MGEFEFSIANKKIIISPIFQPYHMFLETTGDISDNLLLLQLWLGLSTCCGCLLGGTATWVKSRYFFVSKRYLLQISQFGAGESFIENKALSINSFVKITYSGNG